MDIIRFEWDENKNEKNKIKHKISFEEAQTVFYDTEALLIDDPEHSQEEDRFIILGISKKRICLSYVIATELLKQLSELYQHEKPLNTKKNNIGNEVIK